MFKFLKSTILIKIVMALTGLAIVAFLFLHAIGNLQFWLGPDAYNTYAAFLQEPLGLVEFLWLLRVGLITCLILHIISAVYLRLKNNAAKPVGYQVKNYAKAKLTSRTMLWTGLLVLTGVTLHLLHFTTGTLDFENGHNTYEAYPTGDFVMSKDGCPMKNASKDGCCNAEQKCCKTDCSDKPCCKEGRTDCSDKPCQQVVIEEPCSDMECLAGDKMCSKCKENPQRWLQYQVSKIDIHAAGTYFGMSGKNKELYVEYFGYRLSCKEYTQLTDKTIPENKVIKMLNQPSDEDMVYLLKLQVEIGTALGIACKEGKLKIDYDTNLVNHNFAEFKSCCKEGQTDCADKCCQAEQKSCSDKPCCKTDKSCCATDSKKDCADKCCKSACCDKPTITNYKEIHPGAVTELRHDVYAMVGAEFSNPWVALLYIIFVSLVGFHLNHAIQSAIHTLGIEGPKFTPVMRVVSTLLSIGLVMLFIVLPLGVLANNLLGCNCILGGL